MAKILNEAPLYRMILGELLEVGVEFADWSSVCDCSALRSLKPFGAHISVFILKPLEEIWGVAVFLSWEVGLQLWCGKHLPKVI